MPRQVRHGCAALGPVVTVEQTDPRRHEVARLLEAYEREIVSRYPGGSWDGTSGRKDMLWVAWDESHQPVGLVALRELAPDLVEIKHLYVVPQARRNGVGIALLDAFEAEARRRGAGIVLETGTEQPEAVELYRRRGYTPRDRYEGADTDGERTLYFARAARQD